MRGLEADRFGRSWLAFVIACVAGCHHGERPLGPKGANGTNAAPTVAVTRAQEADMQIALGRAAEQRGDLEQAMLAYKDALTRDKHRGDAYHRLAILHDHKGEFRQSAEYYRQAIAASPGNPEIFCDMGFSLYLQRRWAESEQNLRQAISLRPEHARAHNNLGSLLAHDGRLDEALAEFRKAGNDDEKARANLALALTLEGKFDEARTQYQMALAANPAAPLANARLKELDKIVAQTSAKPATPLRDQQVLTTSASTTRTGKSPVTPTSNRLPALPPAAPSR